MFSQYLGQYLLNKGLLTPKQLSEALTYERSTNPKLGVLAIDAGFMTAAQVERVNFLQRSMDKKFGEIAVDRAFISISQLEELLSTQKTSRLSLSQVLVDKGFLSLAQLEAALERYKRDNKLTAIQLDNMVNQDFDTITRIYLDFSTAGANAELLYAYVAIAFRYIYRILGEEPVFSELSAGKRLIAQTMTGDLNVSTGIEMDDDTLLNLARNYSGEDITEVDELALDSIAEFLNEINGLFTVNMSDRDLELDMQPPQIAPDQSLFNEAYSLSAITPHGVIGLKISITGN